MSLTPISLLYHSQSTKIIRSQRNPPHPTIRLDSGASILADLAPHRGSFHSVSCSNRSSDYV